MKTIYSFLAFLMLVSIAFIPYLREKFNDENISITISDKDDEYEFSAKYNENKTLEIRQLIGKKMNNKAFINTELDKTVEFEKENVISIKSTSNKLKILLNKRQNTQDTYQRIKEIVREIRKIIDRK